ncbi:MAG TPA: hypothetical protein VFH81_01255, partial [Actinomycetota bacterium]|nr:hypothetical protein [Actinomycetota bacterium]
MTTLQVLDSAVDALRHALEDRGLILDPPTYRSLRAQVNQRGRARRDELRRRVGSRRWRAAVRALDRPLAEEAIIRVLGFGDVLTRFSVTPLGLTQEGEDAVAQLGALANLIVTFYDELADRNPSAEALHPRVLTRLARGGGPGKW